MAPPPTPADSRLVAQRPVCFDGRRRHLLFLRRLSRPRLLPVRNCEGPGRAARPQEDGSRLR